MFWKFNDKDYQAMPITIGDWKRLGSYLRACLLSDLKDMADLELRLQIQTTIQMRDYDESNIMIYWGRRDIRNKLIRTIFKNEKNVTDELIAEFSKDEQFHEFIKSVLRESGIAFTQEADNENPLEKAESE